MLYMIQYIILNKIERLSLSHLYDSGQPLSFTNHGNSVYSVIANLSVLLLCGDCEYIVLFLQANARFR